uniref:exodeoxyribonuclease III n=1 Tax=Astyanax mexicanus TaxID=7994 RepID=A0A3B1KG98_ASTMX
MVIQYNIISCNVNGCNTPVKRIKCLDFLYRKGADIALIQETHLKAKDVYRLQNKYYKIISSSSSSNKTKGVLILVKRKLNITVELAGGDSDGRWCFASIILNDIKCSIVSVYAPNIFDPELFCMQLIVGGDFNSVIDPKIDRTSSSGTFYYYLFCMCKNSVSNSSSDNLNSFLSDLNLYDPWRLNHSKDNNFTFFSPRYKTFSRLDYIFILSGVLNHSHFLLGVTGIYMFLMIYMIKTEYVPFKI